MTKSIENLQRLLKEVDTRKKELGTLQPMRREDEERLWKKLRLEWNYNSNHIEGNTLTYQETELVLIFDQAPNGSHTVREIEEMKAHDVAVALVRDWANDEKRELSEADIRDLNRILLVRPFWKEAITPDGQSVRRLITVGDYKKHPNSVRLPNGEMFHYASPEETPRRMAELVEWYRQASEEQHPAVVAARLHYDFVCIHPFDDGNGRVSRLLMNYHLLRNGFPPVVIKSADKKNYLAALQRADVGDFESFSTYIAQQMLWSLDLSVRAGKGEGVEEVGDWEKQVTLLKREAEAKKESEKQKKLSLEETLTKWLEKNFPILRKEMENKFAVFEQFFSSANFDVTIGKYETRLKQVSIVNEPNWGEIAKGILSGIYHPSIALTYNFKGFLYYPIEISNATDDSLSLLINFTGDNIKLSNTLTKSVSDLSIYRNLTEVDFQPIYELANFFYEKIESAVR